MAVTASKVWVAGEVLTASDLNGEFTNILSNGQLIGFPRTTEADFAGNEMWLDSDKDSSFTMDTDDLLELKINSKDLFRWDGRATTPVNGLDWVASATGVDVAINAAGDDTNVSIDLVPKGTGTFKVKGVPLALDGVRRAAAANVTARTLRLRVGQIESNHVGEAQSLSF